MDYKQFVEKVREYTGLSDEESPKVIGAVLETFGERLSRVHRRHLAAQLPRELKPFVLKYETTNLLSLELFYSAISVRADVSFHETLTLTRNVFRVVREAVSRGELDDIFSELPPEFGELLGRKQEKMSAATVDTHELFEK